MGACRSMDVGIHARMCQCLVILPKNFQHHIPIAFTQYAVSLLADMLHTQYYSHRRSLSYCTETTVGSAIYAINQSTLQESFPGICRNVPGTLQTT